MSYGRDIRSRPILLVSFGIFVDFYLKKVVRSQCGLRITL